MTLHKCDGICVCPADGKPLFYHARTGRHACSDPGCLHAHGLELADSIQETVRAALESEFDLSGLQATPWQERASGSVLEDLHAAIRKIQASDFAKLERVCEEAIQGGEHGVVVSHRNGRLVFCEVSPYVPYGQIYSIDASTLDPAPYHTPPGGHEVGLHNFASAPDYNDDRWRNLWEGKWLDWQDERDPRV